MRGAEKNGKAIDRIRGVRESSTPMLVHKGGSWIMRWFLRAALIVVVAQLIGAVSAFGFNLDLSPDSETLLAPEPPFVICKNQKYALCAAASCFVYDGVAYCKCDVLKGDSISLQLSYSSPAGEQNVCSVNHQGKGNGYMVSTFSLPQEVKKGGPSAVYTCPGSANAGSGVVAPVAFGQCDGGICFKSSRGQKFPGFAGRLKDSEIICSCPVSTSGSDSLGYQVFGPYNPSASAGSRCDASACATCSVPNPTANGASLQVGAATGIPRFLTVKLDGPPFPAINECLCKCTQAPGPDGSITCTVAEDTTP